MSLGPSMSHKGTEKKGVEAPKRGCKQKDLHTLRVLAAQSRLGQPSGMRAGLRSPSCLPPLVGCILTISFCPETSTAHPSKHALRNPQEGRNNG